MVVKLIHSGEVSTNKRNEMGKLERIEMDKDVLGNICTELEKSKHELPRPFDVFIHTFKATPECINIITSAEEKHWKILFLVRIKQYDYAAELSFKTTGSGFPHFEENDIYSNMKLNAYEGIFKIK